MTVIALTIAGSDPSGGAGIQADLKTFHQHGVYGTSVITLLTVQNTQRVSRVEVMAKDLVLGQLAAVLEDVPPSAAKTGALGNAELVAAIGDAARDFDFPLVVDPVMISKHGAKLIPEDAIDALRTRLIPHATLITPNVHEAAALSGVEVRDVASARRAAEALARLGCEAVLVKGGHLEGAPTDVLLTKDGVVELAAERVETRHTHGTGCTYSAAITARLACGDALETAVAGAKAWLTEALRRAPGIGAGVGPVDHLAPVDSDRPLERR